MPPKKESDKPPKALAATTQVTVVNPLLEDTSTSQAAAHKNTHVWVKLAELVGDEGSYIRIPLDTPSFGSEIIRAVPGLSPSDFMKTKLHLVSRTSTPTSATERAALRQPPFASTNPVGTDSDGYFFLVTPPKAEGSTGCSKALGKFGRTVVGKVTGSIIASLVLITLTASVTVYLR